MVKVTLRKRALLRLRHVVEHTDNEWGTAKALELSHVFKTAFDTIAQSPRLGRSIDRPNMYALTLSQLPFIIIYKIEIDCIRIVTILHTKQNR